MFIEMVTFQKGYTDEKKTWDLKETINLIKEVVLANWNEKHKGKKEDGKMGIGKFLLSFRHGTYQPTAPSSFI